MIFGIDEVGKGPLAGPVCIGIVALDSSQEIIGLKDSKKLSEKKREELSQEIKEKAAYTDTLFIEKDIIDKLNIKNATIKGMEDIILNIPPSYKPTEILIDGNEVIKTIYKYQSIIKGDETEQSIMAASIIAKVERDKKMKELDKKFPMYGFASHKGYGTKEHIEAIKIYGPCVHHRESFKPIKGFDISAIEAFDIHEKRLIVRDLLINKSDNEIKEVLTSLIEKANLMSEKKMDIEIERIDKIKKLLNEEWIFAKEVSKKRGF